MPSDFDAITAALHGDKKAVLKDQLERIQREVIERLAINIRTREAIHELVRDLRTDILGLEPHGGEADDHLTRHERLRLKEEHRALVLRITDEQRSCWNDTQALKTEARLLEKDLLQLQQRNKRLQDFL